jgi:hypothetical protein
MRIILAALLAAPLVFLVETVLSQEPSSPPIDQPATGKQHAEPGQNKILDAPTERTEGGTETGQKGSRHNTPEADKKQAEWLTAIFTGGIVLVGILQLLLFVWQLWLIRESLDDAKLAAGAAKESADASKVQADIAQKTLISTHRPKLIVRELIIIDPTDEERNIRISYVVANIGASEARIVESWIEIQEVADGSLRPLQPTEGTNVIGDETIDAGTRILREQGSTVSMLSLAVARQIQQRSGHTPVATVYFRGWIVYADRNMTRRRTAFCRAFDHRDRRFRIVDDPDYEYAD